MGFLLYKMYLRIRSDFADRRNILISLKNLYEKPQNSRIAFKFGQLIEKDRGKGPMTSWQPDQQGANSYSGEAGRR